MHWLLRLLSLRHMAGAPLRSALTILGVAVGVATMVGVTTINRSVMDAFRSTVETIAGKADLTVAGSVAGFEDALVETVRSVPGVAHASGGLTLIAPVKGVEGVNLYVMGVDLLDDGYFRTYEGVDKNLSSLTEDLEFLNSTDRMLVSERFARERGLKTGDTFSLQTTAGPADFIVHALIKEQGPVKAFGGAVAVMDVASAQAAFGRDRRIDRIDVALAPGASLEAVKAALQQKLGPTLEVERPDRRGGTVEKMLRSFQMGLNLGSAVALLVGVFLVYNTVSIGVLQRRREIGTLRALGATRLRIRALFTMEAVVLGSFGTVLGLPFGLMLARAAIGFVSDTVSAIYVRVNAADVRATALEIGLGIALGVLGSAFAALRPAVQASRVQPVEALRRDVTAGADVSSLGSFATIAGLVLLAVSWPLTLIPPPIEGLPLFGYLAIFAVLMATALLAPWVLRGLHRLYQRPGEWVLGISGRLAADNFARSPVRTAIPVSALALGISMTVCIAGFVGSFEQSSMQWIEQAVPADLFVTSASKVAGSQNQPMRPDLAESLQKIEGVREVDKVRLFQHDVLGLRVMLISVTPEIYHAHGSPTILEGSLPTPEERASGKVTISENLMRRRDLHVGDTFEMVTPTGTRTYSVGAVLIDYTSDQGAIFMARDIFIEQFGDDAVDSFHLYLTQPSMLESVRRTVTERWGTERDLYVLSNSELREEAKSLINGAFSVTYAMEVVAVLLALLGVINTLLAAVLDRTREIGLLRAVGASRGHVIRLFIGEAAFIGVTGGLLGCAAGFAMGFIVTFIVGEQSTGWRFSYQFPVGLALQMTSAAAVCAVLAGIYPARRAASLDVVEALAYE